MAAKFQLVDVTRKHKGQIIPTEYQCEIQQHTSISILKEGVLVNTFLLGDMAEYDSYNLSYYGKIAGITPSRVTVIKTGGKAAYMSLYEFCWRNYDFDLEKKSAENYDTLNYI